LPSFEALNACRTWKFPLLVLPAAARLAAGSDEVAGMLEQPVKMMMHKAELTLRIALYSDRG
jgi:hypothetical protein